MPIRTLMNAMVPPVAACAGLSLMAGTWLALPAAAASVKHHPAKHAAGGLPTVGHATALAKEPVIHAGKGRPPAKLLVKNLVNGTGATVTASSTVLVKYVGANYKNGKDFTAVTWQSGQPTSFPLSGVVPGFAEGLVGMKVGGRREIVIPPALGYQNHANGPIKATETLVFVVDLESVSS